jgi:hypothetical protein
MSKTFPQKIDKKIDVSFHPFSLVLSRFRMFLSDGSSKTLQKALGKKIVSKSVYKQNGQNPKPIPSRYLFIPFLPFFGEGLKTRYKQNIKYRGGTDPVLFSYSDPPTPTHHHGGH